MKQLTFMKFNNYFNRQVKVLNQYQNKLTTYVSYIDAMGGIANAHFRNVYQYNFKYGNGIDTQVVVNWALQETSPFTEAADYCIVVDNEEETADPLGTYPVESRWFVMECFKNREGQYVVSLHRDVIADNYDKVLDAPVFIEKGMIENNENPLLFNSENNTFNQIKQSEKLLKDETNVPWIVGYVPRDAIDSTTTVTATSYQDQPTDITVNDITSWGYYQYCNDNPSAVNFKGYASIDYYRVYFSQTYSNQIYNYYQDALGPSRVDVIKGQGATSTRRSLYRQLSTINAIDNITAAEWYLWADKNNTSILGPSTQAEQQFINLSGKTIKDSSTGTIYRISLDAQADYTMTTNLYNVTYIYNAFSGKLSTLSGTPDNQYSFEYKYRQKQWKLTLTQIATELTGSIRDKSLRYHLVDAAYDMFCIPYGELPIYQYSDDTWKMTTNKEAGLAFATAIRTQLGDAVVYDLQLVPYCPIRSCIKDNGHFRLPLQFDYITQSNLQPSDDGYYQSVILWCTESNLSFDIFEDSIFLSDQRAISMKADNECKLYRLCDPTYNAYFDFSLAKNAGFISNWKIDCTYKPYAPYIHVAPEFHFMYGKDFNDARGLVCGGDYSLAQLSSAWANYQLQNKNYNEIFGRQLQNLDIKRKYDRINDITGAIVGTFGAGVSGAQTGAAVGGAAGAVAGGVIGTITSAVGGATDLMIKEKLYQEDRSYMTDMYNYNLGNIQAIPYGLTKVAALNANNKIWPFLEIYSASDEEIAAFKDQLKYDGMTLMVIGKIPDYITNAHNADSYIKGKVVRLSDFGEDDHMASAINDELNKGVYF